MAPPPRQHVRVATRLFPLLLLAMAGAFSIDAADGDGAVRRRNDLLLGKIHPDGIEYFDFFVEDDVVDVTVSLARASDDADCGNKCDSELELFLRHGSFPTETIHDQRMTATRTEHGTLAVEHLRTGRYFLSLNGGQLYDSLPMFVDAHPELQYSLNITYTTCARNAGGEDSSSDCVDASALAIAPPMTPNAALFPTEYYKPGSRILGGCVDSSRPTLRYTFQVEEPKWELSLTLSTTFAAGFRMTAFTSFHVLSELPRSDVINSTGIMQSLSILPGAGFRSTTMRFTAPPTGRWVVIISGNLTDNSTCATNGGAAFAFEASDTNVNCSMNDVWTRDSVATTAPVKAVDNCSLKMTTLEEKRETAQEIDELLDAAFVSDELVVRDYNMTDDFAVLYKALVDPRLAGANLELRVEATRNLPPFHVLIRVDAFPTETQFDYQFKTRDALPLQPVANSSDPSANASLDMQAFVWKPFLYPKTGTWYLLLVPDIDPALGGLSTGEIAQVAVNVSLMSFACPTRVEDACSAHGKCRVTLSANGRSLSSCRCEYGYAGEQCETVSVDRTYRGTQVFFTMISNLAILPVTWLCLRRQLFAESILFAATGTISTLYHACDFDAFCALPYSDLHHMDFALSFNMIAVLVVHLSGARNHLKAGLQVFYLLSMVMLTASDSPTSSIAWIVLGGICVIQFAMAITYYVVVGSTRMGLGKTIALRAFFFHSENFDRRYGIAALLLLAVALSCWFTATSPSYWIVHSLWHVSAMLAAFCVIGLRRNDRYQLITPDFSIDVLATPPQFRFAVSSVKSVDILEDMSDSGHGHRRAWR